MYWTSHGVLLGAETTMGWLVVTICDRVQENQAYRGGSSKFFYLTWNFTGAPRLRSPSLGGIASTAVELWLELVSFFIHYSFEKFNCKRVAKACPQLLRILFMARIPTIHVGKKEC